MTRFHLLGIGGAGMSVVAELLSASGMEVSGSDQQDSDTLQRLASLGIKVFPFHHKDHVPADAIVVVSTAIRDNNPELSIARQRGQRVIHRSQALALAATGMRFVAVAGAHGKTTTSGMLSELLTAAGVDPSFAVGSVIQDFGSGAHLGSGDIFVAEADESDGSFLNYSPVLEIVTAVEPDHLDFYGSFDKVEAAFAEFAEKLSPVGTLVACADNEGSARLAKQLNSSREVLTYGFSKTADVRIKYADDKGIRQEVSVESSWGSFVLELSVGGVHNALNATAAWTAAVKLGVSPDKAASSIAAFHGTARRFDFKGEAGGIQVFDDYAHHPTEVKMAIKQAQKVASAGRVVVVFQPHLYSRTATFAREFAGALDLADIALVTDIYRAREDVRTDVDAHTITQYAQKAKPSGTLEETLESLPGLLQSGDLVVTMGAGSVTQLGPQLLNLLNLCDQKIASRGNHG